MNKLSNDSKRPLKSNGHTSANPPGDKPKDSLPSTFYTIEQWQQDVMEDCKRLNNDEAYRKEVAKRQF